MGKAPPFWAPEIYQARRPRLLQRARILRDLRGFFEQEGFLEIEASALQISPGNEAHIGAFATVLRDNDGQEHEFYLHSSPEFDCKKLLAAGEKKIFSLGHAFRNGERSSLHHPEFTMLEWYRADAPYTRLIEDCVQILRIAARGAEAKVLSWRGVSLDPFVDPEILTVAEAFSRYAGIDLMATWNDSEPDRDALAEACARLGLRVVADDSWSDLFSKILSDRVERRLGHGRATILIDYPASEAALARRKAEDTRLAERFELYGCGVELANAFGELTDPIEQRRRFEADMAERARIYGHAYPIDEDFLAALAQMPAASGVALGFDRLVMLACGADKIEQVLFAPVADVS